MKICKVQFKVYFDRIIIPFTQRVINKSVTYFIVYIPQVAGLQPYVLPGIRRGQGCPQSSAQQKASAKRSRLPGALLDHKLRPTLVPKLFTR